MKKQQVAAEAAGGWVPTGRAGAQGSIMCPRGRAGGRAGGRGSRQTPINNYSLSKNHITRCTVGRLVQIVEVARL